MSYVNKQFGCYRYYQSKIKYIGTPNHYKNGSLYLTLDDDLEEPVYLVHDKKRKMAPETFKLLKCHPRPIYKSLDLSTYFKDPLDPTDGENSLFEIEMGYPNPLIRYLVKYAEEEL